MSNPLQGWILSSSTTAVRTSGAVFVASGIRITTAAAVTAAVTA